MDEGTNQRIKGGTIKERTNELLERKKERKNELTNELANKEKRKRANG